MLQARLPMMFTATLGMLSGVFAPAMAGASSAAPPVNSASCPPADAPSAQWWLDLRSTPVAQTETTQRSEQLQKINTEQAEVMQAVQALGACVVGSVQRVRNALAVQATPAQMQALRKLPQVRGARPVTHTHRTGDSPPQSPAQQPRN